MFACTMCGFRKSTLGSNPEFEFRSRRRNDEDSYVQGISDWCTKCEALRFFFKVNDIKDPTYFGEQPKQRLANFMLEASSFGWKEEPSNSRKKKEEKKAIMDRKTMQDLRHEARKVIREELLANLPPDLLQSRTKWDQRGRSHSEGRGRLSNRAHQQGERRSKSVINEVGNKPRVEMENPEFIGALAVDKTGNQMCSTEEEQKDFFVESYNLEDMEVEDEDSPPSVDYEGRIPLRKLHELEMISPWHEMVQRRRNELPHPPPKRAHRPSQKSKRCEPSRDEVETEKNADTIRRLTIAEVERDIKQMEQEDHIHRKLEEKKHLISEWELIRRRVEHECDRVKAELAELRKQRDKGFEWRFRRSSPPVTIERQQGGAQFGTCGNSENEEVPQVDDKNKAIGDAIDAKLERMLDTLQETTEKQPAGKVTKEPDRDKTTTAEERPKKPSVSFKPPAKKVQRTYKPKRLLSKLHILVSTVQRARFRGFAEDPLKLLENIHSPDIKAAREPPPAQFSTLPCGSHELINLLSIKREVLQPNVARPLRVCRSPIFCPDADCRRMFFISDFNDHLTHEHPSLAMERITPCKAKTFFLDTRVTLLNKAKCNMVYFVKDKFIDSTTDRYPGLLPVLVMTARLHAPDFFAGDQSSRLNFRSNAASSPDQEIFLIWLTSVRPEDVKIVGTLSVWPTSSQPIIEYLMVQTSEVYNIRSAQKLRAIYGSTRVMALPGNIISRMTDNGEFLLAVQVLIH